VSAYLKITLRRSRIGSTPQQRAALRGLGLRRLHGSVLRIDDAAIRGLVSRVAHLVEVEPAAEPVKD
jgi:large subunit ribosomal protein L30